MSGDALWLVQYAATVAFGFVVMTLGGLLTRSKRLEFVGLVMFALGMTLVVVAAWAPTVPPP